MCRCRPIEQARAAIERAMGTKIEDAAAKLQAFANANDAREQAQGGSAPGKEVEGYRMEEERRATADSTAGAPAEASARQALWWAVPLLALLALWRWRVAARTSARSTARAQSSR